MLQISTGRFARDVELYETLHRAVLYTNLQCFQSPEIETVFGRVMPSSNMGNGFTITCEVLERLEAIRPDGAKEILISTGGNDIVSDLAVAISFCLNATCTTEAELTQRLLSDTPPITGGKPSKSFLKKTFDKKIYLSDEMVAELQTFFEKLLNVPRKNFVQCMTAMRRYVLATHRMAEEPSLAYSLLVMALESLAQNEDLPEPEWSDYDAAKRKSIDKILKEVPSQAAEDLRKVILKGEHVATTRRFREFVLQRIEPSYYRKEAENALRPFGRMDIPRALNNAYDLRSKYVHQLAEIPGMFSASPDQSEKLWADGDFYFSFEGLARLVRHVIKVHVRRLPKLEFEQFDYRKDLPGIVTMQLAPQYWIWKPEGFNTRTSRRRFAALLEQVIESRLQNGKPITELSQLLDVIEEKVTQLKSRHERRPMLAIYFLYNAVLAEKLQRKNWKSLLEQFKSDFTEPSVENAALSIVLGNGIEWDASTCASIWEDYSSQRLHKNGFKMPERLEVALLVFIAEKYRLESAMDKANEYVAKAVEAMPGFTPLIDFEKQQPWKTDKAFPWYELTLSSSDQK